MTTTFRRPDGRTARAERTRAAVASALLGLFEDGHLRPTAAEIAERAGVSLRSVFQHFEDMETLLATVADVQMARFGHFVSQAAATGPLTDRITALVERRAALLEMISPVRRAALLQEPFSKVLAERLRWAHETARAEVERTFAPELATIAGRVRADVIWALDVATNWSAWDSLRRMNGLSLEESKRVMMRMISALLTEASR